MRKEEEEGEEEEGEEEEEREVRRLGHAGVVMACCEYLLMYSHVNSSVDPVS